MAVICAKHCISLFQRSMESLNLLQGFWQPDDMARQDDLETLQRTLDSWYYGFGSPAVAGVLECVEDDTGGATLDNSMHWLIREQIADLYRISLTGPSSEIRNFAKGLLIDLKTKKGFRIPHVQFQSPSAIINQRDMPHLDCLKEEPLEGEQLFTTYALFREHWFQWGRLENYVCIMGFHPEYLECYIKMQAHLFRADLPIPYPDRHYLAILAAAEQRCVYLVMLFARQFLAAGGDPTWLQGLHQGPIKWRQLARLNSDLCATPWKVTADQLYNLTHGGQAQSSKETLSLSELMHAVAIMIHVHALACFVFGCSVSPEMDHLDAVCAAATEQTGDRSNGSANPSGSRAATVSKLSAAAAGGGDASSQTKQFTVDHCPCPNCRMGASSEATSGSLPKSPVTPSTEPPSATQLLNRIQDESRDAGNLAEDIVLEQFIELVRSNMSLHSARGSSDTSDFEEAISQHPAISRFIQSPASGYEDFNRHPFLGSEYCWKEEGCALADRLCTDLGTLMDEKCITVYDLTYNTLNRFTGVDTSLYRHTVWNYVQSLFGVCHDDFRYDCIDRLLNDQQRRFLKTCATRPFALEPGVDYFEKVFPMLMPSEVVHVILVTLEARHQACSLYALRAISECQARVHQ